MKDYLEYITVTECDSIVDMDSSPECMKAEGDKSWPIIWDKINQRRAEEVIHMLDIIGKSDS